MQKRNSKFSKKSPASLQQSAFDFAYKLQQAQKYDAAIQAFEKILSKTPNDYKVKLNVGLCHYLANRPRHAAEVFHAMHVDDPENYELIKFSGICYQAAGNFELSMRFHRKYIKKFPEDYETWLNLSSASGGNQMAKEALLYSTQALSLQPLDPRSHINMGAALLSLQRYEDALTSFKTASVLEPNNLMATMNQATCHDMMGNPKESIQIYESCITRVPEDQNSQAEFKYRMSFPLLALGDLKKGWEYYNYGFIPVDSRSRFPKRTFSVPEWDGRDILKKRLMVWREQGLGDELKFASVINDLRAVCENVIIECDPRLVTLLQRSFSWCQVRAQGNPDSKINTDQCDFDFHVPLGSLMRFLRDDISKFSNAKRYLIPNPVRSLEFRSRIDAISDGRTSVGICWRSGLLNVERNNNYTSISDWGTIFENKNLAFINLQYGDCEAEIVNAEQHFGIKIHRWPDIDLKNDLEAVAALIDNLDCVVSAGTAVAVFAEAMDKPVKVFVPGRGWTFLGQDHFPWASSNTEYFFPSAIDQPVSETLPAIALSLQRLLAS